jgi:hypothetical protein
MLSPSSRTFVELTLVNICQGSTNLPRLRLGGLWHSKKGIHYINDGSRQLIHEVYLSIFLSLYPKISVIASGATPIGSAGRAPDDIYSWLLKQKEQIRKFYYSHRERPSLSIKVTRVFYTLKQSNKTTTYDSRVTLSQQNSNAVIYHEGKTPGSILYGPVYAHGCALLECNRVYETKKILVDALGTLRTTGIHFL